MSDIQWVFMAREPSSVVMACHGGYMTSRDNRFLLTCHRNRLRIRMLKSADNNDKRFQTYINVILHSLPSSYTNPLNISIPV